MALIFFFLVDIVIFLQILRNNKLKMFKYMLFRFLSVSDFYYFLNKENWNILYIIK